MVVAVSTERMSVFISKFVPPNNFMNVDYHVVGNNIYFYTKVGRDIISILNSLK